MEQNNIHTVCVFSCFHLQLLNSWPRLTPMQSAAANSHHYNGLPACHVANSRLDGWIEGGSASRAESTAENETRANRKEGKGRREEEVEMSQTHPLEVLSGHPSSVSSTLRHIVQQLDILTQVSYQAKLIYISTHNIDSSGKTLKQDNFFPLKCLSPASGCLLFNIAMLHRSNKR